MKGIRQHPKMFVYVSVLGLVLALGLIEEGDTHNYLEDLPNSDYDNDYTVDGIRYNASVSSLNYNSSTQQVSSFHLIFLENHSDFVITSRYLYAQFVYLDDQATRVKNYVTPWLTGPRVEPIEDTPPPEEVNTRDDTVTTNVGDLSDGHYWINAYTQLEFKEEGTTSNLLTPRAEAAKRFMKAGN